MLLLVAALAAATPAWAEPVRLEAVGEAAAGAADARTKALDAAFAEAVSQSLERLVDAQVQRRRSEEIARVTVRRARRFVLSYRVLEERTRAERLQVRITAQVDMDALRATLAEIGVEARAQDAAPPAEEPATRSTPGAAGAPGAIVLVRVDDGGAGRGGEDGLAAQALSRQVSELGFAVRQAGAGRARPDAGALPFDEDTAAALGQDAGAVCVVVAGLEVTPAVRIRGTRLHGAGGRAIIRVLDVRSGAAELVAEAELPGGGFADTPAAARARAGSALATRLARAVAEAVSAHFRPAVATEGALLVEIRGHTRWQDVAAIITHLARSGGVERVWPRRVGGALILAEDTNTDGERAQRPVTSALERLSLPAAALAIERTRQGLALTLAPRPGGTP